MRTVIWQISMLVVGSCGVDTQEPGSLDDTPVSIEEQALSYQRMGFARVSAAGAVVTQYGTVSVSHSTGKYTVTFAGLGDIVSADSSGGHIQIAAEGASNVRCRSIGWGGSPDLSASVQCNAPDGSLADSGFAILFVRNTMPSPRASPAMEAYTWVMASGGVSPFYDYNSSGVHNTATKTRTGSYGVTIPNAQYDNASMMVTSYGGAAGNVCTIGGWGSGSVWIECRDRFGNSIDSAFTLSYSVFHSATDKQGGHTLFDGTSAMPGYTDALGKWWCSSRSVSGSRDGSLASIVVSGELGSWSASPFRRVSFVSKYQSVGYCKVESLSSVEGAISTATTTVRCYTPTGAVYAVPKFTFTHATSDYSGPC